MAEVDRDLEVIIEFCKNFDKEYLQVLEANAQRLKQAASSVTATLGSGTMMSAKASEKITDAATKLLKAADQGEQRIREIQRKAQEDLARLNEIER